MTTAFGVFVCLMFAYWFGGWNTERVERSREERVLRNLMASRPKWPDDDGPVR